MYDNLTRTNLEFAHREAEKRIEELEKENAELEQQIVQLKKDVIENESDCANCGLRQENAELKSELTKKAENKLLGERCTQLLKDKGDLTDRLEDLQEQNSHMFNTIALQEQQIEQMKCCGNCSHDYDEEGFVIPKECNNCIDLSNWELKE